MKTPERNQYPEREGKNIEFKEKLPDLSTLAKTCVAFANGSGGEIVLGVEDGTRNVRGIDESARNRIYDDFPNCLYDSVSPALTPQIVERNIGGAEVLVIKIYPGTRKPYFIKSAGTPHGVFVRVGSSTRRATTEVIDELVREQRRVQYDEESSGQNRAVLSTELLNKFYGGPVTERRLLADHVLVSSADRVTVSNAGILMFCDQPHEYIPEASLVCTRFAGSEGRSIVETSELTGPIPLLVGSAFSMTLSLIERDFALKAHRLIGKHLAPPEAVREAIVNALVHRKYSIPGPVKIARFDDRLEIFSPGAFPGLVSLANLGDGTTFLRNTVVARLARRMKIMEKLGIGIRLIIDSCAQAGIAPPEFSEDGDFVKVTLFFHRDVPGGHVDRERILRIIREEGVLKPGALTGAPGVSRRSLSRLLSELVAERQIVRHGTGAGVYYTPG